MSTVHRSLPRTGVQQGRMVLFDLLAETYWGGFISGDKGHDALGRELQVRVGRTARGAERSS
ncbi:MAG TPA: hypothetical protein VK437_08095, partial [Steroidobacteraceae bacterium]|nr:hypothetical protein [Steroidobacteraceae bacterium]